MNDGRDLGERRREGEGEGKGGQSYLGSWSVGENKALATGYDLAERGGERWEKINTVREWAEGKGRNVITHGLIVFIEPHLHIYIVCTRYTEKEEGDVKRREEGDIPRPVAQWSLLSSPQSRWTETSLEISSSLPSKSASLRLK